MSEISSGSRTSDIATDSRNWRRYFWIHAASSWLRQFESRNQHCAGRTKKSGVWSSNGQLPVNRKLALRPFLPCGLCSHEISDIQYQNDWSMHRRSRRKTAPKGTTVDISRFNNHEMPLGHNKSPWNNDEDAFLNDYGLLKLVNSAHVQKTKDSSCSHRSQQVETGKADSSIKRGFLLWAPNFSADGFHIHDVRGACRLAVLETWTS